MTLNKPRPRSPLLYQCAELKTLDDRGGQPNRGRLPFLSSCKHASPDSEHQRRRIAITSADARDSQSVAQRQPIALQRLAAACSYDAHIRPKVSTS